MEDGQDVSCSTQSSNSLALNSGQSMYGLCEVTGKPVPYMHWMFCPSVCDNLYPSNVTSSDICQPVNNYDQNDTSSPQFIKSNVKYGDSGLYVCTATYLDAVATVYNVCVSVGELLFRVFMNRVEMLFFQ